jgi:hypothetical protein
MWRVVKAAARLAGYRVEHSPAALIEAPLHQ